MLLEDPRDVAVVAQARRRAGRARAEVEFAPRGLGHRPPRLAACLERVGGLEQVADGRSLPAESRAVLVVEGAPVDQRPVGRQEEDLRRGACLQRLGERLGRVVADGRAHARGRHLRTDFVVRLGLHRVEHEQGDPAVGELLFQLRERRHLPLAHRTRGAGEHDRHARIACGVGRPVWLTGEVRECDIRHLATGQEGGGFRRGQRQSQAGQTEQREERTHGLTWRPSSWPWPPATGRGRPPGTSGWVGGPRPSSPRVP